MWGRPVVTAIVLLASSAMLGHVDASSAGPAGPAFLYTAAREYDASAWLEGRERFPRGAKVFLQSGNETRPLMSAFAASADPAVSFDGTRVLFAGKQKAGDPWQIYEISVAGGEARRVTSGTENCVRPLYLPEDRVVYARRINGRFVIEVAPLAGGNPLPLTYTPGSLLPTDVLRDGRVLFEGTYPYGSGSSTELFTVYSDGSGVESYRCDHGHARHSGKQVDSGDIVFVSNHGLSRFTSALAHEVPIAAPAGEYAGDVAEMSTGEWLLAWRSDSRKPFQLKRWKPGSSMLESVATSADENLVQPAVVASRAIANRHPSGLHEWNYANLLCLNAYTSKYSFPNGAISLVRLYTQGASGNERPLGTAPVEDDGSFYLRTPADQPLKIELLDHSGRTLKREAGWFWMRRGEQRVCVGCHAGPETAPENAVPAVLQRSIVPADMTGAVGAAPQGGR
jgi:Hydrazine synthase alpha subunit middle domain